MPSAKSKIVIQDRAVSVIAKQGTTIGLVVKTNKGDIGKPRLVSSIADFTQNYGFNPTDTGSLSAEFILEHTNKLYVSRAAGANSKSGGVLLAVTSEYGQPAITPLAEGVDLNAVDSFNFPKELTTREYGSTPATVILDTNNGSKVYLSSTDGFQEGKKVAFSDITPDETLQAYTIITKGIETRPSDVVTVQINGTKQYEAGDKIGGATILLRPSSNSGLVSLVVDDNDNLHEGSVVDSDNNGNPISVSSKSINNIKFGYIIVDKVLSVQSGYKAYPITTYEVQEVYSNLIYAVNQGDWSDDIEIETFEVSGYNKEDLVFGINVYDGASLAETFVVSRKDINNDFGEPMNILTQINDKSRYIRVIDNPNALGTPLPSNKARWQQNPSMVFRRTDAVVAESISIGDKEVYISTSTPPALGDQIFIDLQSQTEIQIVGENKSSTSTPIYTVQSVSQESADKYSIKLDKAISKNAIKNTLKVWVWDKSHQNTEENIENGLKSYPVTVLDAPIRNVKKMTNYPIGGKVGTILDTGSKFMSGGYNGDPVTTADLIAAVKSLESVNLSMIGDSGYTIPAYQQAVVDVAVKKSSCHAFLNISKDAEESSNYLDAIKAYQDALAVNDFHASLFVGWEFKYSQLARYKVALPMSTVAMMLQSISTVNNNSWVPAAGLQRGKFASLGMVRSYSEAEMDWLVDRRINPFIFKSGVGYALWGNETSYTKPSPLQLRSVVFLLSSIEDSLNSFIDYTLFDQNNEETWSRVEGAINAILRDEYKAKGAVYDYKVAVKSIITDVDIDNRRLPVFIGIQPTMDIQMINVNIGIFNKALKISV